MDGFFQKKTVVETKKSGRALTCVSCGLAKNCTSPKMEPFGNFKKGILNIGEAPGETEDEKGRPWQGKTGRLLQHTYRQLGIDLFEDCLNMNAVNCRPMDKKGNNRAPINYEIDCCRRSVMKCIQENQPRVIILLGSSALYSVLGTRWKKDLKGISRWRGFTAPDQELNAWVCPTFHPSFVERDETGVAELVWKQDLENALMKRNVEVPINKKAKIELIEDLSVLSKIKAAYPTVFDYETTGKKPHQKGHQIKCMSIADSPQHAYVFMMPEDKKQRQPVIDYLADPMIQKAAHNMKFEEAWSEVILKTEVQGWHWDTMQMAHILDNRTGVSGLKFQVYVNFGVVDYSSEIEPYLKAAKETSANDLNRIDELLKKPGGKEKLMTYCAWDSLWEYRLMELQKDIVNYDDLPF